MKSKRRKGTQGEHLSGVVNFACVLRGESKYLEQIKEYIIRKYMENGLIDLEKPKYDRNEIYIITSKQWEEYQRLKKKDPRLIGFTLTQSEEWNDCREDDTRWP